MTNISHCGIAMLLIDGSMLVLTYFMFFFCYFLLFLVFLRFFVLADHDT